MIFLWQEGGAVYEDFWLHFKVHNVVSVQPKNIKLDQTTSLNVIFLVVVSGYQYKIWNSSQFLAQLQNGR